MWEEETDNDTDGGGGGERRETLGGGAAAERQADSLQGSFLLLSATKDHPGRLAHASHTLMVTTPDTPMDLQAETNIYSLLTTPDTPRDLTAETNIYCLLYSGEVLMSKAESEAGVYVRISKHGV